MRDSRETLQQISKELRSRGVQEYNWKTECEASQAKCVNTGKAKMVSRRSEGKVG